MTGTMRINKAIAAAGVCSRRKADELIMAGAVEVNGQTVTEQGLQIDPAKDSITVHGKKIHLTLPAQQKKVYILMHKPVQVVSTASDPDGRTTVLDLLPPELRNHRVYPVGRLDYFSEGLLLLTNDGELTHRLTHPRYHLPKKYEVLTRELPTERMLQTMRKGMTLAEGEKLAPVEATLVATPGSPPTLHMTLHQGINRQIRRMCRDLGLTILFLKRYEMGPVSLGLLPKGETRPLSKREIRALYEAVQLPFSEETKRTSS